MAKKYMGANTLTALIALIKTNLSKKIDVDSIANDLVTSDSGKVLGASQAAALLAEVEKKLGEVSSGEDNKIESLQTALDDLTKKAMTKDTYDTNDDGKIDSAASADKAASADNATKLGGIDASKYAQTDDDGKVNAAKTADTATNANKATTADTAKIADKATTADSATNATNADNATKLGGVEASKYVTKNGEGKIDSSLLPSYVDDVIDGYYHEGNFYKNDHTIEGVWPADDRIEGEEGKIYVDVLTTTSYRWSGTVFAQITSTDMVEITSGEVDSAWDAAT